MLNWTNLFGGNKATRGDVRFAVAACTDTGRRRDQNEDSFLLSDLDGMTFDQVNQVASLALSPGGFLQIVADGLGGHRAGAVASRMAAQIILEEMQSSRWQPETGQRLLRAVQNANWHLRQYAQEHAETRGMGTTITAAFVYGEKIYLAQVGDSRAYLLRQGILRQLTQDQTLARYLAQTGQAKRPVSNHILTQAVGTGKQVNPVLTEIRLQAGDCLLLCSDGLFNKLSGAEIEHALNETGNVSTAARWLVAQANQRGGEDNITAIVTRFRGQRLRLAQRAFHEADTLELPVAV